MFDKTFTPPQQTLPAITPTKLNMETEHSTPNNCHRSLLALAELIKAIVEEMSEQEVQQSSGHQQFTDDYHQSLLAISELIKAIVEKMSKQEIEKRLSSSSSQPNFRPLILNTPSSH